MNDCYHNDNVASLNNSNGIQKNTNTPSTSSRSSFDASNALQQGYESHTSNADSHIDSGSIDHDRDAWDFKALRLSPCWYASSVTHSNSSKWSRKKNTDADDKRTLMNDDDDERKVQQILSSAINWQQPRVRFALEDLPKNNDNEQEKDEQSYSDGDDDDRSLCRLISSSDDVHSPPDHMANSYTFNGIDDDASTCTGSVQTTTRNSLDVEGCSYDALLLPAKLRNMYI